MIYTLTLNPAVDYTLSVKELLPGNIIRSNGETFSFGGKGINVSLILNELDIKSVALGFIAGFTGEALEKGITTKNITPDFVKLNSGITRINVKIRSKKETDINGTGPKISPDDINRLTEKLGKLQKGDILVLAGSVPAGVPNDIYEKIMSQLYERGIKFVVDAEKDLLLAALKYSPFLIKPNKEELEGIFAAEITTPESVFEYAKKLQDMGAENVLISLGGDGAILLDKNGEKHYQAALGGKPVNTVGAGDSMVAGFIAGYLKTGDFKYALNLGSACGGATACSMGLATKEKIEKLKK